MWPSVNRAFLKARLPRRMYLDLLILPFSLWLAFVFHYDGFWPAVMEKHSWLLFASPAIALPIFVRFGMYRAVPAYASTKAFYSIVRALTLQTCLLVMTAYIGRLQGVSMTVFAIYWFVSISLIGSSRILLRSLLIWLQRIKHPPQNVVIYGAGSAGAELAETLQAGQDFLPMAFIDDKHELHGKEIRGVKVYPTDKLDVLIPKTGAKQILLAIPSAKRARRKAIVSYLEKFPVHVRTVPALADIVSGRSKIQELREIDLEDVLGREPVPPDQRLLSACITGKSVMVTGAGGSIGSELCRQIVQLQPSQIVLFEASEFALYRIDRTLREICTSGKKHLKDIEIVPIIGSVTNEHKLKLVINTFAIQTVYHAAAYKHVPLVEHNPIEGVKNNVFGTWCTAKTVVDANIETFVLISTDKAVRPTNVMGATKRLAEIYVQALARESNNTRMSIVRFGNVLGSSGSVVPLFRRQIQNGGPITLTHPEMTRYFMTIPEAAQLVIQAGAMARGCDVFVLDMGNPVRILDLARRMISLSGLTIRDTDNPDGDISIEITCPRPGEKLCEELILGDNITRTDHPSILRANEMDLPLEKVLYIQDQLESSCNNYNIVAVRELMQDIIEGYVPQCGIEDFVWIASQRLAAGTHDVVNY
jgi:FlaA1/EpsC-like NDP-sugar epimerase